MSRNAKNTQSNVTPRKANAKSNERPTIVLKTILDDICRENKIDNIDAKKVRARLRATPTMREIHTHNASWIFTQSQYDVVRSMFDAKYAQRIAQRAKRATSTRVVKAKTQSHDDVTNVVDANVDANA